jgi:hypothetical protein
MWNIDHHKKKIFTIANTQIMNSEHFFSCIKNSNTDIFYEEKKEKDTKLLTLCTHLLVIYLWCFHCTLGVRCCLWSALFASLLHLVGRFTVERAPSHTSHHRACLQLTDINRFHLWSPALADAADAKSDVCTSLSISLSFPLLCLYLSLFLSPLSLSPPFSAKRLNAGNIHRVWTLALL